MMLNRILIAATINPDAVDSFAGIVVVVGVGIVFLSLLIIYLFFRYGLTYILNFRLRHLARKQGLDPVAVESSQTNLSGEVNAAIGMALYLYQNELHDEESGVITIKRVSKTYSPWSSKLYSMQNRR